MVATGAKRPAQRQTGYAKPTMKDFLSLILLWLVIAVASVNALHDGLLLDDRDIVANNPHYGSPGGWLALFAPSKRPARLATYRPVRELSFAVDAAMWRESGFGRHVSNLVAYLLAATALWALGRRLGLSRSVALAAACWFGLHGAHSEALGWVKNRGELLAAVFGFVCLIACQSRRWGAAAVAVACLLAAAGSMESGLFFAGIALAAAVFGLGLKRRETAVAALLVVVAVAYGLLQTHVLSQTDGRPNAPTIGIVGSARLAVELGGRYASMALLPSRLCVDPTVGFGPTAGQALALLVVAAVVGLVLGRGGRAYAAALALVPLLLLSLIAVRDRPVAEHRAFVASGGVALCLGWLVQAVRHRRVAAFLMLMAACAMASLFVQRHFVWRDDASVWRDTVVKAPALPKARMNFAWTCARQGLLRRAERQLDSGLACYPGCRRQLNLQPPEALLHEALARVRAVRWRLRHAPGCSRPAGE